MPFSIKTKQVAGVTLIVGVAVILLSGWYIKSFTALWLNETKARAELLAYSVRQRAFDVVRLGTDPVAALQQDAGLRSILESSVYSESVLYAEVVDTRGIVIAHLIQDEIGKLAQTTEDISVLLNKSPIAQIRAIYQEEGQNYEFRLPLFLNDVEFGQVRIGVSTLLVRRDLINQLVTPLATAAIAIVLALLVATVLAQITLRPIHVIRSGLARLGRGELDVSVDLKNDAELAELGDSFKAVSARLAADRAELAEQRATLESVVENLEDAVALFDEHGALLFANPAMRAALGTKDGNIDEILPADHPYRVAVHRVLAERRSLDPLTVRVPGGGERLLLTHCVGSPEGQLIGVMLVARNLSYLSEVESTLSYSRKLAALGRLSAGIAHEVKNPLNATMIHLELLRMQLAETPEALEHVKVISAQMHRLDEVVQGFLKFTRPEDLQLQPVALKPLVEELMPVISAEASKSNVDVVLEFPDNLPPASADPGLIQQAFLNLALNACQAMPHGGRLRIAACTTPQRGIQIVFEDSGIGIDPDHLARIFDLYFTTKETGSGIGLSLVYRTVQLHDGTIEVRSAPGSGTTFSIRLHQAPQGARESRPVPGSLGLRSAESV